MIITKTPFRVSFFGGGTDYPEYFRKHGGAVLGTAIDKFAYHSVTRFYSRLFDYSVRISYRQVECVKSVEEIQHAPFRECLKWCGISGEIEVNYAAELPSFSGLGSSSSFVVGLLNALYAYQGKNIPPLELARQAIELEREVLKETVGCQDQVLAAVGGFNVVEFRPDGEIVVRPLPLRPERIRQLEEHLLMVFTGLHRRASDTAARQVQRIGENGPLLRRMREMVEEAAGILMDSDGLSRFGNLLHEAWMLKRQLDSSVSNGAIDRLYREGMEAGALGGKLLGAGGGGFLLFFVPPERREKVKSRLSHLEEVKVKLNAPGSHVIHHSP